MINEREITNDEFKKFRELIYSETGIFLAEHKKTLVQSRLRKWLKQYNLQDYHQLYAKIQEDKTGEMITTLFNSITTNVTSFFREANQWVYLKQNLSEILKSNNRKIRIWSAACSSGQEPYSILIFLKENLVDFASWDIKILATDISQNMLSKAIEGEYSEKDVEGLSRNILLKYFGRIKRADGSVMYKIDDELKRYVTFRVFNLVRGNFSVFQNKFDLIFCRNVMIYFDRETQNQLLQNFSKLLKGNSRIFIGHSESIHQREGVYQLVAPSIYKLI